MWVKKFNDGGMISESDGKTWRTTPLENIAEVWMIDNDFISPKLAGYSEYWYSKTAIVSEDGKREIVRERIQGLRSDGMWDTIEWDANHNVKSLILKYPLGK